MIHLKTLLLTALCSVALTLTAQNIQQDNTIRIGHLDNGLTYYIKHNNFLPNTADFYIAQRVGSILEEPHQRGLAHFLEHMAFNGSQHFPPNDQNLGIVQWCERVGIKFGVNLNAYTSIDQTVYNISSAPVNKEGVVDTCLLIMHDWSNFLTLSPKEIDKERGVVHEEWRIRRSGMAMQRLMEASAAKIYKGTKYEDCMPIGDMNIIDHFPYQALTDYYKKWYRPDLQAIIVVGDVNVDSIEQKIKNLFGSIPKPQNPAQRIYYPVSDNEKMIVFAASDKEQPVASYSLYMKRDVTPRNERATLAAFKDDYMTTLIVQMLNARLDQLVKDHSDILLSASVQDGNFFISTTKDAFTTTATFAKNNVREGIRLVTAEVERARKQGFLPSEWERAKAETMNDAQNKMNDSDKIRNSQYVESCLDNFLENKPIISPATNLDEIKALDRLLTLAEVNDFMRTIITNRNMVATLFTPQQTDNDSVTEAEIERIVTQEQAKQHADYKEQAVPTQFMTKLPKRGKIVKRSSSLYGYEQLTLSNGMRVFVKKTNYENDEVNVRIFGLGGKNQFPAHDTPTMTYLVSSVMAGGIDKYDDLTLQKMLTGKTVNVSPFVGDDMQGIKAFSTVRNMKELFQLINLYFTSPRKDTAAFRQLMDSQREFLSLRDNNPNVAYNDTLLAIAYNNNERIKSVKAKDLALVDYDKALEMYRQCFHNAANFDVIITGNVSADELKPYLCQYLASLPTTHKREGRVENDVNLKEKTETHLIVRPQETPSVHTSVIYSVRMPYTVENELKADVLSQLLRAKYIQTIREDKGAAYGVSVSATLAQYPYGEMVVKVGFKTAPEKYKMAIPLVDEALQEMRKGRIDQAELDKVKTYLLKTYDQVIRTNDYWEEVMFSYLYNHQDFDLHYRQYIENLTTQSMQQFAEQMMAKANRLEVTMTSDEIK